MNPNQIANEWENLGWALGHLSSVGSGLFNNFSKVNEGFV